jgi:hypothetical protein
VLVENFTDVGIREYLFGFGEVSIAPGEIKELPDAVVALWTDPKRQKVRIRKYVPPVEPEPVQELDSVVVEDDVEDSEEIEDSEKPVHKSRRRAK